MKNLTVLLFAFIGALLTGSCSSAGKNASDSAHVSIPKVSAAALTREAALLRSKQISHVSYTLWFGLDAAHSDFEGRAIINFELRSNPKVAKDLAKGVILDFEGGTIRSLKLNGNSLAIGPEKNDRYDGHRIRFAGSEIVPGMNRAEIAFSHAYSGDGEGFIRFVDPVDHHVYLYTQFEPYGAHKVFPCFDQPDLKGSFELTVETPENWQVIANTKERDAGNVDGRKSWAFPPSPRLSPYVFALHAGPYAVWEGDAEGIPLRLFARKSLAPYVDYKNWFEVTSKGLAFFSIQFGYPYPYSKYDQVIVPDFRGGAMENAAAITFSERYVFRARPSQDELNGRSATILHEMAHMWFGDLVTMRWWNGLWLNESFASVMEAIAAEAISGKQAFENSEDSDPAVPAVGPSPGTSKAWRKFAAHFKRKAYRMDQLPVTHSIEVPIANTDEAESNFDDITYGKGAAVLKQLRFFVGEDEFRDGVQRYFLKYALRSTSIGDFMKILAEASGLDLAQWQKLWLQTPGLNTVKADWSCELEKLPEPAAVPAGSKRSRRKQSKRHEPELKISRFVLHQGSAQYNEVLRPHRTVIALFNSESGPLKPYETLEVSYSGAETEVRRAIGKPCPKMVFPNYGDQDYVKVLLDPLSAEMASKEIGRVTDPLLKEMLLFTYWDRVLDGEMKPQEYAELALRSLKTEKDPELISDILYTLASSDPGRSTVLKFMGLEARSEFQKSLDGLFRKNLLGSPAGSELQRTWYDHFLDVSITPESLKLARELLDNKTRLSGFKLGQDERWELVQVLARRAVSDAAELIQRELKTDSSARGEKQAIYAEAQIPDSGEKKKWLDRIVKGPDSEFSESKLQTAMKAFQVVGQEDLERNFLEDYFERLPQLASRVEEAYALDFIRHMFPNLCDPAVVQEVDQFLAVHPSLPVSVLKKLKIGRFEEERCIRTRRSGAAS